MRLESSDQSSEQVVICDHDGISHSIDLPAGHALLYESARLLHSRPHPFQVHPRTAPRSHHMPLTL